MSTGDRIKARRERAGLSLGELANRAGMSRSYLHELEHSQSMQPSAAKLYPIALHLGCTMEDLIGEPPLPGEANAGALRATLGKLRAAEKKLERIEKILKGQP